MTDRSDDRKTSQAPAPGRHQPTVPGQYDLYPAFPLGPDKIELGFAAIARKLAAHRQVIVDGYVGVFWEDFRRRLDGAFATLGRSVAWINVDEALRPEDEIDDLIEPYLGGDDPLFGTRFTGELTQFFDPVRLSAIRPDPAADIVILYGCGAALAGWEGLLVYVDLPKNEIQFRSRAGAICNLGARAPADPKTMYKRFYFVDWVALNRHKAKLLPRINLMIDGQRPNEPASMRGEDLRDGLTEIGRNYFRVRPWFEPGPWGGQWIKQKIPQLPQDVPNYAWSFELIVPENGLAFTSDGRLLEISFDMLMYHDKEAILGDFAERFGYEFPIRFDFLDTWDGGNLSLQCHPLPEFIRRHFGESFTQDETYYMLDCQPDASVYLGFQQDIDPAAFRRTLEASERDHLPVDVERFVQKLLAAKHDLFLIPSGTVHCSGKGCLVLEISATPYIFTFKMYDWLRLDLEGKPRPLNIERAFENLRFDRKGKRVASDLLSHPTTLERDNDWRVVHLPTHPEHFYGIHRLEFSDRLRVHTQGSPHVLSLVDGRSILLQTADGRRQRFNYAETFVVPAAARFYELINEGDEPVRVIKAFLKPR